MDLFLVFAGLFIVCFILFAVRASILDAKSEKARMRSRLDWLEEERRKPRFFVEFITSDGNVKRTDAFEPCVISPGSSFYCMQYTSKKAAQWFLEYYYEQGFLKDRERRTYPVCNIKEAYVKEEALK